jgi:hypothetical protein
MSLQLKVGHVYLCRKGKQVTITEHRPENGDTTFRGQWMHTQEYSWWYPDGRHVLDSVSSLDLIADITPKPRTLLERLRWWLKVINRDSVALQLQYLLVMIVVTTGWLAALFSGRFLLFIAGLIISFLLMGGYEKWWGNPAKEKAKESWYE